MKSTKLAQTLAVESQVRMLGSAGRLLKQIRDIESVAPRFKEAGLVKVVERPAVMDLTVSGVATKSAIIQINHCSMYFFVSALNIETSHLKTSENGRIKPGN